MWSAWSRGGESSGDAGEEKGVGNLPNVLVECVYVRGFVVLREGELGEVDEWWVGM